MHKNFNSFQTIIPLSSTIQKFVERLMGPRIVDVAFHLPVKVEERTFCKQLDFTKSNELSTLILKVSHHVPNQKRSSKPYAIYLSDGQRLLEVLYFRPNPAFLKKLFPVGESILISGKLEHYPLTSSMFAKCIHPDFVGLEKDLPLWQGVKPIYPLTAGLQQNFVQRFIAKNVKDLEVFPEWLKPDILAKMSFPSFNAAIKFCHIPSSIYLSIDKNPYKQRLCFDEFLAHQLSLILSSRRVRVVKTKNKRMETPLLVNDFIEILPFSLTDGQKNVIEEIVQDFSNSEPMVRLLQGDVGSGKTVVAYISSLYHIAKGGQVAFLVPTEILAQQHFLNIQKLFGEKIRVELLIGRCSAKQKNSILENLKNHEIDLLIGTHALIQDTVIFNDLTFCIIDEQHRFGVEQRMLLNKKSKRVDLLSMTATPIPRSLTLAQYGDMDVSILSEKPKGRKPITTTIMSRKKYQDLVDRLKDQIAHDIQVYWVCPLIEESTQYTAAIERFEDLKKTFGADTVALVHGKMKAVDKDASMQKFKDGTVKILVATTVIEVGVDVPNASIMIIENAEKFGLAQLHQLRGRVGRGSKDSYCILLYGEMLTTTARQRLDIMKQNEDGFKLAEMDLKLRGSGQITGTQQSGMPAFKFSNFDNAEPFEIDIYNQLMEKANAYAWHILEDPAILDIAKTFLLPLFNKNIDLTLSG